MKNVVIICAIAALCSAALRVGPIILQRFDWSMVESRKLGPGELAYFLPGDGTAIIRLGDGDAVYGLPIVDPASVRISAKRVLSRFTDYYVEPFGGAVGNANGTFTIGADAIAATGGLRIVSQNARTVFASVDYDVFQMGTADEMTPPSSSLQTSPDNLSAISTNIIVLTATANNSEYVIVSNLTIHAWVDRSAIGVTNDFSETTIWSATATDVRSPTTLGQMQDWLEENEGRHWSLHGALRNVQMMGFHLIFDAARRWTFGSASSNSLLIAVGGDSIASFFEGSSTNAADSVQIVDFAVSTNGVALYVRSVPAPVYAPRLVSTTNISSGIWQPYTTSSNSWPNTIERITPGATNQCYVLEAPSPAVSRFFKVFADLPGDTLPGIDVRSFRIDGYDIYLETNGVVMWR